MDYEHLASKEKNPKKKRLMTEAKFETFTSEVIVSQILESQKPLLTKKKYNNYGYEVKVKDPKGEEQSQGFLSKYWWVILIIFILLQVGGGGGS